MSESLIERVARAIYDTWAQEKGAEADWQLVCDAATTTSEKEFPALHETYNLAFKEARAAIDAMRGLPPTMADAACQRMLMGRCSTKEEARQLFAEGWQAAIDAALNE